MIRAPFAALLLTVALSAPLTSNGADIDSRLHQVRYDAGAVVKLHGRRGYQSMIQFASDERIENVAVGDSAAWQVTPNKRADILFVKPIVADARTNMTVITDQRTYMFDLLTAPAKSVPAYALSFNYPEGLKRSKGAASAEAGSVEPKSPPRQSAPVEPPLRRHFGWTAKGDATILPASTYDDGFTTFLSWPEKVVLPAILALTPDGVESPVNFAAKGDVIEVDQVHPVLILRAGDKRATLTRTPPVAALAPQAGIAATLVAER